MAPKNDRADSDPLPFVQFDRAVMAKAALLAQRMGTSVQHAMGALVSFWSINGDPRELAKLVAEGKREVVLKADVVRRRFLVAADRDLDPLELEVLGLLEARDGTDEFRVRGMSRFFGAVESMNRAREAGKAGGRKSAALRQNAATPQPTPQAKSNQTSDVRRQTSELFLGADAPGPKATKPKGVKREATPPDPRHRPLVDALVKACPGYQFDGGLDARAVTTLLTKGDPAEVERRWRQALAHQGFPTVRTLPELARHWNHFNPAAPTTQRTLGPADPLAQGWRTEGPIEATTPEGDEF